MGFESMVTSHLGAWAEMEWSRLNWPMLNQEALSPVGSILFGDRFLVEPGHYFSGILPQQRHKGFLAMLDDYASRLYGLVISQSDSAGMAGRILADEVRDFRQMESQARTNLAECFARGHRWEDVQTVLGPPVRFVDARIALARLDIAHAAYYPAADLGAVYYSAAAQEVLREGTPILKEGLAAEACVRGIAARGDRFSPIFLGGSVFTGLPERVRMVREARVLDQGVLGAMQTFVTEAERDTAIFGSLITPAVGERNP